MEIHTFVRSRLDVPWGPKQVKYNTGGIILVKKYNYERFLIFVRVFFQEPHVVLFVDVGHSTFSAAVVTFVQVRLFTGY